MKDKITVFLTVYKRLENFRKTLEVLGNQTFIDFDVVVINNNLRERGLVNSEVWNSRNHMNTVVVHMDHNAGTLSRYVEASQRDCDFAIFLDDDIILRKESIETFVTSREKGKAKSCLGSDFENSISSRKKVYSGPAKILGAGVMIFDAEIIRHPDFFFDWKPEYYTCDDVWFSYFCEKHGFAKLVSGDIKAFLLPSKGDVAMLNNKTIQDLKQRFCDEYKW